jgi:hypothetical protein
MKKNLCLLFCVPLLAKAQSDSVSTEKKVTTSKVEKYHPTGKNIFKVNLSSLAFSNYYLTYERQVGSKISLSVGFRYMPTSTMPFASNIQDAAGIKEIDFSSFQMGNTAITPEIRFYAHKNMRGFYMAPYARYASFDLTIPVKYGATSPANFAGAITSFSGGLLLGTQHNIGKHFVIDIWIIGGHFGSSNGTLNATNISPAMSPQAQAALQQSIDGIDASPFKITGKVTSSTTAYLNESGWVGFRGLGFNIGFRF